jgi:transcriptional regulator with XRE-family HTH domain
MSTGIINNCCRIEISNRLRPLLKGRVPEIIKKTGWNDQTIRRWLKGSLPNADVLVELCGILNVSILWLLTGEDAPQQNNKIIKLRNPQEQRQHEMHNRLDEIYESGHSVLISAIESNLVAFHESVLDKRERKEMSDRIKRLEQRGG